MKAQRSIWRTRPFVVFSLLLLLKIYMAWFVIFGVGFSPMPLVTGLPSVLVAFFLIELLAKKRKLLAYMIVNVLLTSIYFAVIMYYKYYGVIVTYHALQQLNQLTQVKGSVLYLMHPYFLFIYTDFVLFLLLFIFKKSTRDWARARAARPFPKWVPALGLAVSLAASYLTVWVYRDSINEVTQAEQMGILNYETFTVFGGRHRPEIDPSTVTNEAIEELKGIAGETGAQFYRSAEGRNVIVVQLESFQNFLIGLSIDGKEITPVMNGLMREGLYFPHFYQQVGQGNTSDAEFVLNTSLYIPRNGAASQDYTDKALPSLPKLFKERGYAAVTFHTNDVVFWNRGELYEALGFDRYYDRPFFGDVDPVHFGSSDEVLYDKTAAELANLTKDGKKVYANVISMTAHHPFDLPEAKSRMTLPDRYDGTFVGDFIESQNYADYALGTFVDKLKQYGLWENSMLVVYGDHVGLTKYQLTDTDETLLKEIYGREYSYAEMLNIPLLIVAPGATPPTEFSQVGGQSDLLPTIANLSGIPLNGFIHFGQDLLNHTHNILPEHYYLPSGSFINDEQLFIPGAGFTDGTHYAIPGLADGKQPSATEQQFRNALKLFRMSESYVRSLPDRQ